MAKKRILIGKSGTGSVVTLQKRLRRLGYMPTAVSTGSELMKKAASLQPELVLMSIHQKGKADGAATAKKLRENYNVPVVYLASSDGADSILQKKPADLDGCLIEPYSDIQLQACIEAALHRHGLQEDLRRKENWCLSILRAVGDAVIVTRDKGKIAFLNPAALSLTGCTLEDALGRNLSDIVKLISIDARTPVKLPAASACTEADLAKLCAHLVMMNSDGSEVHIDASAALLGDGKAEGLVLVFREITDRYLKDKRMLSRQKVEAIGRLAGSVAHDFGNVADLISGYASSMADSLISKTKAHEDSLKILDASKHARHLTDRLLRVASVGDPSVEPSIVPVSVADTINDAVALVEGTFAKQDIEVKVKVPGTSLRVMANESQLLDSLVNLFLNAADAMPDGGTVTVDVKARNVGRANRKLNPNAKSGPYVMLRITDTGPGIPDEALDHIYEPFFSTKNAGAARGLGLTVVHNAILAWGGWINVRSAPQKGTTFVLCIPRTTAGAEAGPVETGGETVLLIDDSDEDIAVIRKILEGDGYKVKAATNGNEGLSLYKGNGDGTALVIIDVIMPEKDGKQVLRELLGHDPKANVIMTCGFSRDYLRHYLGRGGWNYVQKPIERDHLLVAVRRALEQRKAPQEK